MQGHPILFYLIGATDVPTLKAEYPEALIRRYHVQVWGGASMAARSSVIHSHGCRLSPPPISCLHRLPHHTCSVLILLQTYEHVMRMAFPAASFTMSVPLLQTYERVMRMAFPAASTAAGRHIDQVSIIIDLDGMGLFDTPKVKDILMPMLSLNGDNYPEVRGGR